MRDKIDRTIMRSLDMVEKLEKLFGNNGAFEQAVAEAGGDIGWFGDVRENLKTLYSNIEELHMGAVSHMDEFESTESDSEATLTEFNRHQDIIDQIIDMQPESMDEIVRMAEKLGAPDEAIDDILQSVLDRVDIDESFNDTSLSYLKKLAGL